MLKSSKVDLYSLRQKCSPKNLVFSDISLMEIFAEVTENERIIDRHLRHIHPLLDYDASESQSMICQIMNNSAGGCSISIKLTTDYDHMTAVRPQTFKVNEVKVIA